ncbi:MAG: mechanosensitive ion channel family protein [Candidatus Aenigmarchaeota archaeon]|nr:mechanosensitive ion channel family protein [Candidatus Aenigmarchaeota archaeon]
MFEFLVPYSGIYTEYVAVIIILILSLIIAKIVNFIIKKSVLHITAKTKTVLDDLLLGAITKPIFLGIFLVGIHMSVGMLSVLSVYANEITFAFTVIYAAFVGWFVVRIINAIISWYAIEMAEKTKTKADEQFLPVFKKVAYGVVGIIIILWLLGQMGVEITTLVAAMGIGGLALALALQDTLSEFFAGAHIILDRPIKIGDYIELDSGDKGTVVDIGWRSTKIRNYKNNMVVIPNSKLSSSKIINYYSPKEEIGFTVACGVGYGEDLERVEKVTLDVADKVLKRLDVAPEGFKSIMRYQEFGDSNINFKVIMRAKRYADQFFVKHEFMKELKKRYDKEKIEIAWPIRKVYLHKGK